MVTQIMKWHGLHNSAQRGPVFNPVKDSLPADEAERTPDWHQVVSRNSTLICNLYCVAIYVKHQIIHFKYVQSDGNKDLFLNSLQFSPVCQTLIQTENALHSGGKIN